MMIPIIEPPLRKEHQYRCGNSVSSKIIKAMTAKLSCIKAKTIAELQQSQMMQHWQ